MMATSVYVMRTTNILSLLVVNLVKQSKANARKHNWRHVLISVNKIEIMTPYDQQNMITNLQNFEYI